ncbi:hypothetical protein LCGC14_2989250, partial [marine sediment metagenome]
AREAGKKIMLLIATQLTIAIVAVVAFLAGYNHRRFVEVEERAKEAGE